MEDHASNKLYNQFNPRTGKRVLERETYAARKKFTTERLWNRTMPLQVSQSTGWLPKNPVQDNANLPLIIDKKHQNNDVFGFIEWPRKPQEPQFFEITYGTVESEGYNVGDKRREVLIQQEIGALIVQHLPDGTRVLGRVRTQPDLYEAVVAKPDKDDAIGASMKRIEMQKQALADAQQQARRDAAKLQDEAYIPVQPIGLDGFEEKFFYDDVKNKDEKEKEEKIPLDENAQNERTLDERIARFLAKKASRFIRVDFVVCMSDILQILPNEVVIPAAMDNLEIAWKERADVLRQFIIQQPQARLSDYAYAFANQSPDSINRQIDRNDRDTLVGLYDTIIYPQNAENVVLLMYYVAGLETCLLEGDNFAYHSMLRQVGPIFDKFKNNLPQ